MSGPTEEQRGACGSLVPAALAESSVLSLHVPGRTQGSPTNSPENIAELCDLQWEAAWALLAHGLVIV